VPAPARRPTVGQALTSDAGKVPDLLALAEKQEQAKRYNEYVKTLLALAAAVPEVEEKVSYFLKAADLYATKFANQAEAVKAYEQVVGMDPDNHVATDYLRQMYEKRRDWEKLLGLQRREAEAARRGPCAPASSSRSRSLQPSG
jgi:tetratricopeptide (TPR) repeat protein